MEGISKYPDYLWRLVSSSQEVYIFKNYPTLWFANTNGTCKQRGGDIFLKSGRWDIYPCSCLFPDLFEELEQDMKPDINQQPGKL